MHVKKEFCSLNSDEVWNLIAKYITEKKSFQSVTGISYDAGFSNNIFYKGGTGKRSTKGEEISKEDFIKTFNQIKSMQNVNTNTIKGKIPNSLFRKRTPFIGLLYSVGILEQ